jgi:hypothetical protein
MSKMDLVKVGSYIRFSTYDNVESRKIFEGEVVMEFKGKAHPLVAQAASQHANIYPSLPSDVKATTPNDYREYMWVTLVSESGGTFQIGKPWIVESTIETVQEVVAYPTIVNFKDADTRRLRAVLEQAGYEVSTIKQGLRDISEN